MRELVLYGIGDPGMTPARRLARALGGCCVAMLLAACVATSANATPGYPDPAFGHHGVAMLDLEPGGDIIGADIAGDPRRGFAVVTRSTGDHSVLVRLTPDGSVDSGFGEAGTISLPGGPWDAVDMAPDGSVVVAGARDEDLAVARFTPNGHRDPGFGAGTGEITVHVQPLPPDSYFRSFTRPSEVFVDVAIEPDGSILAVGNLRLYKEAASEEERSYVDAGTVVARFRANGALDASFGEMGTLDPTAASGGRLKAINQLTRQPDGRILLAGNMTSDLAVARLTGTGALDPGFGRGGVVVSKADTFNSGEGFGQIGDAKSVLVRPDGRLVVVGQTTLLGLLPNGNRDQSFGNHGRAFTEDIYGDGINANAGALDDRGRILVAGDNAGASTVGRFLPDGRRDRRFGGGDGIAVTEATHGERAEYESDESATSIVIARGGAAVTAGFAFAGRHGEAAVIARAGGDGRLLYCHGKVARAVGTPGPDRIHSYGAIVTMGGDDEIRSSGGPICAGPGDDVIYNQRGDIYAGPGDDQIREDWAGTLHGGPGDDLIEPHSDGPNTIYGDGGADKLVAGRGHDRLYGGAGDDALLGGGGADLLVGGPGNDLLLGGSGTDRLDGGPGSNQLRGGPHGPPKAIYMGSKHDFHIRLRVEGHRITGIHLRARLHCRDGSRESTEYDTNHLNLKINANGHFHEEDDSDYEVGYSESLFAGNVSPDKITGVYRELDSERTTCTTGRPGQPLIHFNARLIERTP